MNQSALRLFVRSIIAEAKEKKAKDEPKKAAKKDTKKPDTKKPEPKKEKKSAGNLVEMKEELAKLKEELKMIDELISSLSAVTPDKYGTDVEIIGDAIEAVQKEVEDLKKEKENLEKEIASLKENTLSEMNKIKEMMGLAPKDKNKKKVVGEEKKEFKGFAPKNVPPAQQRKMTTPTPAAGGKGNKEYSDSDVNYLTDPYEKVSKKK